MMQANIHYILNIAMSSALAFHTNLSQKSPLTHWVVKGLQLGLRVPATLRAALKPRVLTKFEEAAQLRATAIELMYREPSFASDLFAAADRHEYGQQGR